MNLSLLLRAPILQVENGSLRSKIDNRYSADASEKRACVPAFQTVSDMNRSEQDAFLGRSLRTRS